MSMKHPDLDYMIEVQRRRDEMAEAAQYRLVNEALSAARANHERRTLLITRLSDRLLLVTAQILSYTGGRMLNWSCRLQTRYELLAGAGTENRASPCA